MKYLMPNIVRAKDILMRVDFNVEINEKEEITDEYRIIRVLPTIKFLKENKAKRIVLVSHLGQPTEKDYFKEEFSLKPISLFLERLLKEKIYFIAEKSLKEIKKKIENLKQGEIVLLENIRFFKEEEDDDQNFAKELASLGDIYINEAFSVSHRKSASLVGIVNYLPAYAGLLLKEETERLNEYLDKAEKVILVLGGKKIEDKLPLIESFINKAKYILLGGAIANTFLKSWGFEVGKSLIEEKMLEKARILGSQKAELILPGDLSVLDKNNLKKIRDFTAIQPSDNILDIGKVAADFYKKTIKENSFVIFNGPMGKVEDERFLEGTLKIFQGIFENKNGKIIVGGGDTLKSLKIIKPEYKIQNTESIFFSTGGGAMLKYLGGEKLPALEVLD